MSRADVVVTQPIHDNALRLSTEAGLAVTDLRSAVPLAADEPLAAVAPDSAPVRALVCHLTDRVDERVLASPGLRVVCPSRRSMRRGRSCWRPPTS